MIKGPTFEEFELMVAKSVANQNRAVAERQAHRQPRITMTTDLHNEPLPNSDPAVRLDELTERRSKFVYDAARLAAQAANAPIIPVPWDEREEPFKAQFRKLIDRQCRDQRSHSPEELHTSWMQAYFGMGWVFGTQYSQENKTHPDLVPYADLGQLERDKDAVFVALCEIARQWVHSATPKDL